MSIPIQVRTVTGTWKNHDDTFAAGKVTFQSSLVVERELDPAFMVKDPVICDLDANGHIEVELPITNEADTTPAGGWWWTILEAITGQKPRHWEFYLPAGSPIDLVEVVWNNALTAPPGAMPAGGTPPYDDTALRALVKTNANLIDDNKVEADHNKGDINTLMTMPSNKWVFHTRPPTLTDALDAGTLWLDTTTRLVYSAA